jgi:hypothetical protein
MSFTYLTSKSTQNVNLPYLASKFTQTSHLIVYPYLASKFTQILNLLVCLLSDIKIHPNSKFSCFLFAFKIHLNTKPFCLYHVYLQSSPFSFSFVFFTPWFYQQILSPMPFVSTLQSIGLMWPHVNWNSPLMALCHVFSLLEILVGVAGHLILQLLGSNLE